MSKLEERLEKMVGKMIPKKLFDRPLDGQVKITRRMIGMPDIMGGGIRNVRAGLLRDGGMPEDIRGMLKKGMSDKEIKDFYWGCEPFRKLWEDMEMSEGYLDTLIKDTQIAYVQGR